MRGETFLELQVMLREEINRSADVSIGVDDLPRLKRVINRVYSTLYYQHDWSFLRRVFDKIPLSAGLRHYSMPAALNIERIEKVVVWWAGSPQPLVRGIGFEEYNEFDSEASTPERADPTLAWDVRDVNGVVMIEVWPIPVSDDMSLQFIGIRSLPKLVNDADTLFLDDDMVVLYAAAKFLAAQKSEDASIVLAEARAMFQSLKGRSSAGGAKRYSMGTGTPEEEASRSRATIRVGS